MRRIFMIIALLILPGGIVILIFRLIRHGKQHISEFFSRLKQKFLS